MVVAVVVELPILQLVVLVVQVVVVATQLLEPRIQVVVVAAEQKVQVLLAVLVVQVLLSFDSHRLLAQLQLVLV
jgi:hypothetical protein